MIHSHYDKVCFCVIQLTVVILTYHKILQHLIDTVKNQVHAAYMMIVQSN